MSEELYSTPDLWLGALLLAESNAVLVDVQISRNGRETVMFSFCGENLSQTARAYCKRQAVANVACLRGKLNELRDHIFQAKQSN